MGLLYNNRAKMGHMKGMTLDFKQKVQTSTDSFNNPVNTIVEIPVDDCLVAPMSEPLSAREQQAIHQSRDQVRIHIPKAFTGDVSSSYFAYDGKIFKLDSDSVAFMNENTPTRWNRYFRAEHVGNYEDGDEDIWGSFFVTEDTQMSLVPESS